MNNYSITLPSWTVGDDALSKINDVACKYGRTAVIIGGEKSLSAIKGDILAACFNVIEITDVLYYGGEASEENITRLTARETARRADMIFAVGGGKALDTGKVVGYRLNKPVLTFPTIASTCAATTAVAILYRSNGSFYKPQFLPGPPVHTFIHMPVIAKAPARYLWAGLGDTYAKYFEADISSRGDTLAHYHELGVGVSRKCLDPLLRCGYEALSDNRAGNVTDALTQAVLTVIVNTGIASILLTADRIIDYNTGLAHAIFYAMTAFPDLGIEKYHLHGEVVGYGVLIALAVDEQDDALRSMHAFNRSVGLPTRLSDIGVEYQDISRVIDRTLNMPDISHYPYRVTAEALRHAFERLETWE